METTTRERQDSAIDIEPEPANLTTTQEPRRPEVVRSIEEPRGQKTLAPERVIVRHSDAIDQLFAALSTAQGAFKDLERTRTARVASTRAQYTFEYETLADVINATKEGLSENGLSVMQFPFPGQHSVTVRTLLGHKSGQWIYNDLTAAISDTSPQAVASGITYLCRYARKAILGVAADWDDDGGAAAGGGQAPATPQAAQRRSAQPPAAAQPAKTAAPAHVNVGLSNIGKISDLTTNGTAVGVALDSGYKAATRDPEHQKTLRALRASNATVELRCRASSDPAKYAPVIEEILISRRERESGEEG